MMTYDEWVLSQNNGWLNEDGSPWTGGGINQQAYQQYVQENTPVSVPGAPTAPPVYGDQFTMPNQFSTLNNANNFGYNQALGLYSQGPTVQPFGDVTQEAQGSIYDLSKTGGQGVNQAINANTNQLTGSNPYSSQVEYIPSSSPYNFNRFASYQNPYGSQLTGQMGNNPYANNFDNLASTTNNFSDQIANGFQQGNFNFQGAATANPYGGMLTSAASQANPYSNFDNPYANPLGLQFKTIGLTQQKFLEDVGKNLHTKDMDLRMSAKN